MPGVIFIRTTIILLLDGAQNKNKNHNFTCKGLFWNNVVPPCCTLACDYNSGSTLPHTSMQSYNPPNASVCPPYVCMHIPMFSSPSCTYSCHPCHFPWVSPPPLPTFSHLFSSFFCLTHTHTHIEFEKNL